MQDWAYKLPDACCSSCVGLHRRGQHLDAADPCRDRRALVLLAEHTVPVAGAAAHGRVGLAHALARDRRAARRCSPSSRRWRCSCSPMSGWPSASGPMWCRRTSRSGMPPRRRKARSSCWSGMMFLIPTILAYTAFSYWVFPRQGDRGDRLSLIIANAEKSPALSRARPMMEDMPWAPNTPRNAVTSHHRAKPRRCPQDGHRRHPAAARCGARPLDVVDGDQLRHGPGLDRQRQALVAGDAGRSRRQHAGRRQQAAQRDPGAATRCCARSTRCGTPTRCARSCRWTGRRSPARSAPSGCARWPDPAPGLRSAAELNASALADGDRQLERGRPALVGPGRAAAPGRRRSKGGDKRFAAPEWHEQPGLPDPEGDVPAGLGLAAASTARRRSMAAMPSGSASTSISGSSSTP